MKKRDGGSQRREFFRRQHWAREKRPSNHETHTHTHKKRVDLDETFLFSHSRFLGKIVKAGVMGGGGEAQR